MRRHAAGRDAAPARAVDATALPGGRGCPVRHHYGWMPLAAWDGAEKRRAKAGRGRCRHAALVRAGAQPNRPLPICTGPRHLKRRKADDVCANCVNVSVVERRKALRRRLSALAGAKTNGVPKRRLRLAALRRPSPVRRGHPPHATRGGIRAHPAPAKQQGRPRMADREQQCAIRLFDNPPRQARVISSRATTRSGFCLSMIFSENRYTLFRIMLFTRAAKFRRDCAPGSACGCCARDRCRCHRSWSPRPRSSRANRLCGTSQPRC
jgi:hypothetical protein